jgi:Holliday junction resolvasome RuvABC endonuclease subunit
MRLLAIDPATMCGWALGRDGQIHGSGTWNLTIRRDESAGMRLVRFRSKLDEMQSSGGGIDVLIFEAARNAGPKMQGALVVQSEIQGVLKLWCETTGVDYRGYSPSEIKKHATGKGNAGKPLMLQSAHDKWPEIRVIDDNEADALWLLDLAMKELTAKERANG